MDAAKGKWLAILDADDWYHPKRIQSLLEEAERSGADVLGDNIHLLDESAARPWRKHFGSDLCRTLPRNIGIRDFLADMRLRSVKPFMSRLFIQAHNIRYREDYQTGEDVDLLLQCLIVGGVFRLIPDAYYYERRRHHSLRWSRLSHLNSLSKVWTDFTHIPEIAHAPECLALVRIRLEDLDEDIRYTKVIEPMLRGRWLAALTAACSDLSFFLLLLKRLPNMLSTRIRRLHARI
jgi:succinoglycan biosynthesis protein ExoO